MMEEIWKDIEGYEGTYQVSNLGRVRSLDRVVSRVMPTGKVFNSHKVPGRMLKNNMSNIGYYVVNLHKDGKGHTMQVHRLVAQAFIPNPKNLPEVNHKDEDKLDNRVDNLEWCDSAYNTNYGTSLQRKTEATRLAVLQYDFDGNFIAEYPSSKEASEAAGVDRSLISKCCRGQRRTAGGFVWKYKE